MRQRCKKALGFTLGELIAVIAVMCLLITLFIPTLVQARGEDRKALCMNNMRRLHVASTLYTEDYGDWFLPVAPKGYEHWAYARFRRYRPDGDYDRLWMSVLSDGEYGIEVRNHEQYQGAIRCPSEDRPRDEWTERHLRTSDYAANHMLVGAGEKGGWGEGMNNDTTPHRRGDVKRPEEMPWYTDAFHVGHNHHHPGGWSDRNSQPRTIAIQRPGRGVGHALMHYQSIAYRHGEEGWIRYTQHNMEFAPKFTTNVVFVAGNVGNWTALDIQELAEKHDQLGSHVSGEYFNIDDWPSPHTE